MNPQSISHLGDAASHMPPRGSGISLWHVFASPALVMSAQRRHPRFFLPLFLSGVAALLANAFILWKIGFERVVTTALRTSSGVDPAGVVENALEHKGLIIAVQAASAFLGAFVTPTLLALVIWLLLIVTGHDSPFRGTLAVVAHATFAMTLLRYLVVVLTIAFIQNADAFDIQNPIATNVAFFWQAGSPVLAYLLRKVDACAVGTLAFLIIGVRCLGVRISRAASVTIVVIPWVLFVAGGLLIQKLS